MCNCGNKESSASGGESHHGEGTLASSSAFRAAGAAGDMTRQMEKAGRAALLRDIRMSSRKAMGSMAIDERSGKYDPATLEFCAMVDDLIGRGLHAHDWDDAALARASQDAAWGRVTASILHTVMLQDNGGGPGEQTPATKCLNQYNQCMRENSCEYSFICLCCVPCSLEYLGCLREIVLGMGGIRGIMSKSGAVLSR